ncbi:MAG TPA: nucleotidyltransferase family protein [Candidatus Polarisedimenticolia bacterium]|jgi:CTP:molybdopterin cytidylyltransferase MocA|nr:nucleotidyltransferase family protein [Candidatus Polarisedimenticolia bacterium]
MSHHRPTRIGALILAAGDSRRMGRPKALLPLEGGTFLEVLTGRLCAAGVGPILAVLGDSAQEIGLAVKLSLLRVVINPDPSRGQLSSIHCGLESLAEGEVDALFLAPVDSPRVAIETLRRMIQALSNHPLVVPVYQGKRGHPALFSASMFHALRRAPLDVGARAVVHATASRLELPCDDPAVLEDFDTPAQVPPPRLLLP